LNVRRGKVVEQRVDGRDGRSMFDRTTKRSTSGIAHGRRRSRRSAATDDEATAVSASATNNIVVQPSRTRPRRVGHSNARRRRRPFQRIMRFTE
jgi:hypothetical protein